MHLPTALTLLTLSFTPLTLASIPPLTGTIWTKRIFADDFRGPLNRLPSPKLWQFDLGTSYPGGSPGFGTGEVETMTNSISNIHLNGKGALSIIPRRGAPGVGPAGKWTSSRIETVGSFGAPVGGQMRVQANIRMPAVNGVNGLGVWPAFFTLGAAFRGEPTYYSSIFPQARTQELDTRTGEVGTC